MIFDIGESRFFKNDDNENLIGEINYSVAGSSMIIIDHTFVHDDYRGQGIAAQLVERVVEMARDEKKKKKKKKKTPRLLKNINEQKKIERIHRQVERNNQERQINRCQN
eukprot:TRINITY_DN23754_c0_g1_i1.p4 TRINITY_DN23754_c0_g1~~TRINITY_DN23754_c0_g1_i1.p4  ORF type:complete len:109 (+),score=18.56 TRINITY_DN23754_c0_g1_i1:569-895(+)